MSYPPGQPLGMPPMPGMMSTGYTFTPMGMMPMVGMMPPTTMMRPIVTNTTTVASRPKKQLVPQEIDKDEDKKDEKPPVTTVFVGNISDRAPDSMIRTMLQRCGNVLSWKRVQGASGKLQAFGFCEYEDPEATLRCIRLLNEWEIADKKLVVKVDQKTKTMLDEWKNKKKKKADSKDDKEKNGERDEKEEGEDREEKEELDEFTLREDRVAKAGLDAIMREYAFELAKEPASNKSAPEPVSDIPKVPMPPIKQKDASQLRDTGLDDLKLEADTKDLINREIQSFRNLHKDHEETEAEKEREEKEREREKERRLIEERRRKEREKELQRLKDLERLEEMRKSASRSRRDSRSRSRSRSSSRGRSSVKRSRSRERERERESGASLAGTQMTRTAWMTQTTRRERDRELEEEEEAYERRKMEKKIREKELAYQERLKNWEARERKKAREYEKEREREEERQAEESREARRLREFLEDYDDERDDPKFYKGSALERRLRERQKEKEADARDRAKEKEELEEIRRKLQEDGHPDVEEEMAKIEREREEHLRPMLQIRDSLAPHSPSESSSDEDHPVSPKVESEEEREEKYTALPNMKPTLQPVDESSQSAADASADDEASRISMGYSEDSQQVYGPSIKEESSRLGFGAMKFGSTVSGPDSPAEQISGKRKKLTVGDVFNQDDDDSLDGAKKRKLVPLDYGDSGDDSRSGFEGKKTSTAEEKRAKIKSLIENIPTAKDELFAFQLDWRIVDQNLMDKRIKPWVNKKIIEYIGEEEPTLTDFICQKVMAQSAPQNILNDVAMVLDEEAEVFVVKMWRLLVYETEAKKAGLVK